MQESKNMKHIYVNEKWCLGCHLCEYYCAFANSGEDVYKRQRAAQAMYANCTDRIVDL